MGVKEASDKIMEIVFDHIPKEKCDCVFIDDIFLGVSVSISEKYTEPKVIKSILRKCNEECDNYIDSVDFIKEDKSLFNIYLYGHNYIREKKMDKINKLILWD